LEAMRRAGRVVAGLLSHLETFVKPGITTKRIDDEAHTYLQRQGAKPAFLGYRGFPATICVSINDEVVHGIPGSRQLCEGDLVSIDVGGIVDGLYADSAKTFAVGAVSQQAQELTQTTREALVAGIKQAVVGNRLHDISYAVQQVAEAGGYGIVREFVGHGIGRALHEDPPIPNFGSPHTGPRLKAGMVLAIEPMITMGSHEVEILEDGWTAVTRDHSLAAHFEHTVAVTDSGPEVLTELSEEYAERRSDRG